MSYVASKDQGIFAGDEGTPTPATTITAAIVDTVLTTENDKSKQALKDAKDKAARETSSVSGGFVIAGIGAAALIGYALYQQKKHSKKAA